MNKAKNLLTPIKTVFLFTFLLCNACSFTESNTNSSKNSLDMIYGKHKTFDRFVFEYNKKPEYKVSNINQITYVTIPSSYDVNRINTDKYVKNDNIKFETNKDTITISIPANIIKNFEYQNKIVVDVKNKESKATKKTGSIQNSTPQKTYKKEVKPKPKNVEIKEAKPELKIISTEVKENKPYKEKVEIKTNTKNTISFEVNNNYPNIPFKWDKKVGLAAFEKDNNLWLVFDGVKTFNFEDILKSSKNMVSEITQIPNENLTILIMKTRRTFDYNISSNGNSWIVTLSDKEIKNARYLTSEIKKDKLNNQYVYIPTNHIKNAVTILDPNSGDMLIIAPSYEDNLKVSQGYRFVDFKLLPTIQGVVIEAFADDVLMTKTNDGIVIKAIGRGLNITEDLENLIKK